MTDSIIPRPTDRAFFVGQTGSGKTTLARRLLRYRTFVVVLDGKGLINWPELKLYRDFNKLVDAKEEKLIWRPSHETLQDPDAINQFFEWVYRRGNTTCYVDEAATVTENQQIPSYYFGCITRGREHGVEMWSGTQRPVSVPSVLMSEAEHVYCFYLKMETHREKIWSMTGIDPEAIKSLPKHQFLYAPQDGEVEGPLKLRLD